MHGKIDEVAIGFVDELRLVIALGIALRALHGIAGLTKRGADVGDRVFALAIDLINGIVDRFQIPIIQQSHHYAESIEFPGVLKRILEPIPGS